MEKSRLRKKSVAEGSEKAVYKPVCEVVLYLYDPRRRNRQAAHGSRFKVKFVRPQPYVK